MVTIDTLEGIINGTVSYHYDVGSDVLYLRRLEHMQTPAIGEANDAGDIELRDEETDQLVGLAVVSWWKRFGHGPLPDSIQQIQRQIAPLAAALGG